MGEHARPRRYATRSTDGPLLVAFLMPLPASKTILELCVNKYTLYMFTKKHGACLNSSFSFLVATLRLVSGIRLNSNAHGVEKRGDRRGGDRREMGEKDPPLTRTSLFSSAGLGHEIYEAASDVGHQIPCFLPRCSPCVRAKELSETSVMYSLSYCESRATVLLEGRGGNHAPAARDDAIHLTTGNGKRECEGGGAWGGTKKAKMWDRSKRSKTIENNCGRNGVRMGLEWSGV